MFHTIHAIIRSGEESGFMAECMELPVITQGATLDEVMANLREAVSLHFEGEDLEQLGFARHPSIIANFEMEPVSTQA